jgi:hypothetical protein
MLDASRAGQQAVAAGFDADHAAPSTPSETACTWLKRSTICSQLGQLWTAAGYLRRRPPTCSSYASVVR